MDQPISSLDLPDTTIHKLHSLGYNYCKEINPESNEVLKEVNLSPEDWTTLLSVPKTVSALDIYQEECGLQHILTFNKAFDDALGGGIQTKLITEFAGPPGSGKTQLCFQLCVNVQLPLWCGGLAGSAVYLSTNKGFPVHRLKEFATTAVENYNFFKTQQCSSGNTQLETFTLNTVLKNILHTRIDDHTELVTTVEQFRYWLLKNSQIRLVVIDSISAILKPVEGIHRPRIVYDIFRQFQTLAELHNFAIVVTNDVTTRVEAGGISYQTPALGGHYYHRINTRVELKKVSTHTFNAKITKSVLKECSEVEFKLIC